MSEVCLERMGYTVSFNPETNIPNWVAWKLDAERLVERESRSDKFVTSVEPSRQTNTRGADGIGDICALPVTTVGIGERWTKVFI